MIQFYTNKRKPLPKDINKIANERYEYYQLKKEKLGIYRTEITDSMKSTTNCAFIYDETIENTIWYDVEEGRYDSFYKFHNMDRKLNLFDWNFY